MPWGNWLQMSHVARSMKLSRKCWGSTCWLQSKQGTEFWGLHNHVLLLVREAPESLVVHHTGWMR